MEETLLEIIGVTPILQDNFVPNGLPHLVICKTNGKQMAPVHLNGDQWDICYWIWRLNEQHDDMNSMLAEILEELLSK
jgi:hypothetical protein